MNAGNGKKIEKGKNEMKTANRAVVVYHPTSPWANKVDLRLYLGETIVLRTSMRDDRTALRFLQDHCPEISDIKTITVC